MVAPTSRRTTEDPVIPECCGFVVSWERTLSFILFILMNGGMCSRMCGELNWGRYCGWWILLNTVLIGSTLLDRNPSCINAIDPSGIVLILIVRTSRHFVACDWYIGTSNIHIYLLPSSYKRIRNISHEPNNSPLWILTPTEYSQTYSITG